MELHEAIRKARLDLGLSQKKLAELAGVQRRQLATLEAGGNVTLTTLRKILVRLPNLESFTMHVASATVERETPIPPFQIRAAEEAMQLFVMANDVVQWISRGGRVGTRELDALRRAKAALRGVLGYSPERMAAIRDLVRGEDEDVSEAEDAEGDAAGDTPADGDESGQR